MRITFVVVSLILSAATPSLAATPSEQAPLSGSRTRPLSQGAIALIEEASERSAIVRGLMDELENTDLIVYVSDTMPGVFVGPRSSMVFLSGESTARYLLIRIDSMRLSPPERIAALGHELHHALEVAAAPDVKDAAGVERLYRRIGWESSGGRFETEGAQRTAFRIRKYLGQRDKAERVVRAEDKAAVPLVGGPRSPE